MNILLINPGRRDYLVKYFLDLRKRFKIRLFLIDPNKNIPSFKVSKKTYNFICPIAKKKKKFSKFLRGFIFKHNINFVFPLSEHEQDVLASEKKFYEKRNVKLIISNKEIIDICKNKIKTYKFLKKNNIKFPKILAAKDVDKNFPVLVKEIKGSGSKNQILINNKNMNTLRLKKEIFFQKYLKYQEYGMDILNDYDGNFLHFAVKKKLLMRSGDTDRAMIVNPKKFLYLAKTISKNLKHVGNLDVDFLLNKNTTYVLDLNPRFGGGYPFTHEYGYNYIESLILKLQNKKIKLKFKRYKKQHNLFSKGITIYKH